jgi:hypothetical protein
MADWAKIKARKIADDPPPADWPAGVRAISLQGLALFGINEATGQLYWDGRQVRTRGMIRLGTPERWIAAFAAFGTCGTFLVVLARFLLDIARSDKSIDAQTRIGLPAIW